MVYHIRWECTINESFFLLVNHSNFVYVILSSNKFFEFSVSKKNAFVQSSIVNRGWYSTIDFQISVQGMTNYICKISSSERLLMSFVRQLMENGVLKTYTFLYSEDFSCVEKNYGNVVETIDDFKV